MDWTTVDTSRELVGTLALPVSVARTLYGGSNPVHQYHEPALDRYVVGKRVGTRGRPLAESLREPQMQARLSHAHLVPVITVGDVLDLTVDPPVRMPNVVEIVTPFYELGSVYDALLRGDGFDVVETLAVCRAAALGLAELHQEGIVHRDFKPLNVFLTGDAVVAKVGDLGEAHPMDDDGHAPGLDSPTPWIAPEQVADDECTIVSDLFGLGVMLQELLVGGFDLHAMGYDRLAARNRMCRGLTPLPRRLLTPPPWAPPRIRTLVRRLTESSPGDRRPRTATRVADILSTTPTIGWRLVREDPSRWEGRSRFTDAHYAVDLRELPRKGEWEISVLREHPSGWRAIERERINDVDRQALKRAFDLALDEDAS